ncbi:MAG TPA: FecR domain-containing protein [Rhizomicrobium sp.]|nr:FecR domain-containing protein [Rhizomicrobium sp.]
MMLARDIETKAAAWIAHRHFGEWREADQTELEAWLAEDIAHRVAFVRLNSSWQRTGRLVALRGAAPRKLADRNWLRLFSRLAAVLAVVALLGAGGAYFAAGDTITTYSTAVGGQETLRLADGSQIELNTDTVLRISNRRDRREVWLDKGEAYFRITHDDARPFIVTAQGQRIIDLGTRFVVRQNADRVRVAVYEGRVQMGDAEKAPVLNAGDIAVATLQGISVARNVETNPNGDLAWRRGMLVFDNVTLGEAAAEFNRYNHNQIVIADPSVAALKVAGTFPINGIAGFSNLTRHVLGLRVETQGQVISISH